MFSGVITALVTPFDKNKNIDYISLKKLLDYQIKNNIKNILILGTTGECSTIDYKERESLIKFVKSNIPKRCKLIVGTGSNDMSKAILYTQQAKRLGANACLVVTPYYNKCTQDGIVKFYQNISKQDIPFIVYNVPSRTGFNILPNTAEKLATIKNMIGIKEANSNIEHILDLFKRLQNKTNIYCGNDNLNHIFFMLKAKGTISVLANVLPQQITSSYNSKINNFCNDTYLLNKLLFVEPNPIPVKYALSRLGLIKNYLREPLTPISLKYKKQISNELKKWSSQ